MLLSILIMWHFNIKMNPIIIITVRVLVGSSEEMHQSPGWYLKCSYLVVISCAGILPHVCQDSPVVVVLSCIRGSPVRKWRWCKCCTLLEIWWRRPLTRLPSITTTKGEESYGDGRQPLSLGLPLLCGNHRLYGGNMSEVTWRHQLTNDWQDCRYIILCEIFSSLGDNNCLWFNNSSLFLTEITEISFF